MFLILFHLAKRSIDSNIEKLVRKWAMNILLIRCPAASQSIQLFAIGKGRNLHFLLDPTRKLPYLRADGLVRNWGLTFDITDLNEQMLAKNDEAGEWK